LAGISHKLLRLKVIVADDNPEILRRIVSILAVEVDVVATAANGQSALDLIEEHRPDVVVLDLHMPLVSGIEVARELRKTESRPGVVICSVEAGSEAVEAAHQAGALGYVSKVCMGRDLVVAVKSAARGEPFFSPDPVWLA